MSPISGYEPIYNPDRYNKNPLIQETHNCYSYGMDVFDPAQLIQCYGKRKGCRRLFHQPGGTKGMSSLLQKASARSCPVVESLMSKDVPDIKRTTYSARCPTNTSKIALVVDPGNDFHYYRQDPDGLWSDKDGSNKVERIDAEGKPIWNPHTASRDYRSTGSFLNYKDFCGFYCVPRRSTIRLSRGGARKQRHRTTRHRRDRRI